MTSSKRINENLNFLYGETRAQQILPRLKKILSNFSDRHPQLQETTHPQLNERDSVLITYGDQISESGVAPLKTLAGFLTKEIQDVINEASEGKSNMDLAKERGENLVSAETLRNAKVIARTLENQMSDSYADSRKLYKIFETDDKGRFFDFELGDFLAK